MTDMIAQIPITQVKTSPRLNVNALVKNRVQELCEARNLNQTDFRRAMAKLGINTDGGRLLHSNKDNAITMRAILALLSFFDCTFEELFIIDHEALQTEVNSRG